MTVRDLIRDKNMPLLFKRKLETFVLDEGAGWNHGKKDDFDLKS